MTYYSLNRKAPNVGFREAVIRGIAPDKGLYFPERIEPLPAAFFEQIESLSKLELAKQAMRQFTEDALPETELESILAKVLDFEFPVVPITPRIGTLELFHGPTMAFKDVGARFMANCLGYFSQEGSSEVTVLVATSGDTGGAVANGFLGVEGVNVVILYPRGKVSDIQEKQLTTLGRNITALEVDGTFDDCQKMVKTAFLDTDITDQRKLTSANSINVARWLPQMLYFMLAYQQVKQEHRNIVFSVPSGNFGNICAGMVAQRLGMPVAQFIAATNSNDVVPHFMDHGRYEPKPSVATISNAMDVGDPSNFIRIQELFARDFDRLKKQLSSFAFSDERTKAAMVELEKESGYIADPHGAVGYLGLRQYLEKHPEHYGIFLETAHPVKFLDVVEAALGKVPAIPEQIQRLMHLPKQATAIASYDELKSFLTAG